MFQVKSPIGFSVVEMLIPLLRPLCSCFTRKAFVKLFEYSLTKLKRVNIPKIKKNKEINIKRKSIPCTDENSMNKAKEITICRDFMLIDQFK